MVHKGLERQNSCPLKGGGGLEGGGYGKEAKDASFGGAQGLEGQNSCPLEGALRGGGAMERKQRTPVLVVH